MVTITMVTITMGTITMGTITMGTITMGTITMGIILTMGYHLFPSATPKLQVVVMFVTNAANHTFQPVLHATPATPKIAHHLFPSATPKLQVVVMFVTNAANHTFQPVLHATPATPKIAKHKEIIQILTTIPIQVYLRTVCVGNRLY